MALTEAERVDRSRARRIEIERRIATGAGHRAWVERWEREFAGRWVIIDGLYYEAGSPEAKAAGQTRAAVPAAAYPDARTRADLIIAARSLPMGSAARERLLAQAGR